MSPARWFRPRTLWLLVATHAGCGAPDLPPPSWPAPPPTESAPHQPPTESRSDPPPSAEVIASLETLEAVRGLAPRGSLKVVELSDAEVSRHVEATFRQQVPVEMARGVSDLLKLLRLVPESFDYTQTLTRAMSRELAGFYDPLTTTMYLKRGLGPAERANTLNHELVHALQDQHYGLSALTETQPDRGDEASALHALAEGDALSAMLDAALIDQNKTALDLDENVWTQRVIEASHGDGTIPAVVQRSMTAPYLDGLRFVHALRRRGGWKAVDAAWQSPPKSSEQLLHPAKYWAQEAPVPVGLPPAPDESFDLVFRDIQGEQGLRLVLEEHLESPAAIEAASGWAGDRSAVFRSSTGRALAWRIRYDSSTLAERARPLLSTWVSRAMPGSRKPERPFTDSAFSCRVSGALALGVTQHGQELALLAIEAASVEPPSGAPSPNRPCEGVAHWAEMLHAR